VALGIIIIIIIIIIGKRAHFEPQPSLENSARFVDLAVLNVYRIVTLASIISGTGAAICTAVVVAQCNIR
jgi:hypothetical protein